MILDKEQIQRYMRHIIMPEISGPGQKKLLESSVLVCCEDIQCAAFMLYYLTAMGIGKITCHADETSGSQLLLNNLKRLNPDVDISIVDSYDMDEIYDVVISLNEIQEITANISVNKTVPLILSIVKGDSGFVRTITSSKVFEEAISEYKAFDRVNSTDMLATLYNFSCSCLIGTLASIEAIKAIIGIGKLCEKPLYVDLKDYSFSQAKPTEKEKSNYKIPKDLSKTLKNAKVLIVGSGGLGSPTAYILASMGIGKLGLVDFDNVDISNLNRQILHSTDRIGMPKVESAKTFLHGLNPDIEIFTYNEKFSKEIAESLIEDYDIVVDGLDNLPTRYLLNDACYFLKKPLVEAGVLAFNGLATVILPDKGPCYRCTFPEVADTNTIPSCSETGVLGAVPGIMGTLQAIEVVKQLTGVGESLLDKIIMFDALNLEFAKLDIYKEDACPLCGSNPTIDALRDYNFVCSSIKEA